MSSLNKQSLLNLFNQKFIEFLSDLIRVFPEDSEFKQFKATVLMIQATKEQTVQQVFHSSVEKYKPHIAARNDQFFLESGFDDINSLENKDYMQQVIEKLKRNWIELDARNREIVWKYLTLLVALDERCSVAK